MYFTKMLSTSIQNNSYEWFVPIGCETGYYGDHCRHNCDHCMNKANCGITDGRCDGSGYATSGYQPPQCTGKNLKQIF